MHLRNLTLRLYLFMVNPVARVMSSGVLDLQRASRFSSMSTLATDVMQQFHERLKRARLAAGYETAKDFADALHVEPPTYRQWERGHASPDLVMLTRLCKLLDIEPNELLPLAKRKKGSKPNGGDPRPPGLEPTN